MNQAGDGGFSNPRVYNTLEEAVAAVEASQPRSLPDGRVIMDPDALSETADMTDDEAMAWLDIPEAE